MAATIEAFAVYHREKENLNNYLQVSFAGLSLLHRNIDVPNSPELLGAFVDACGIKHWTAGKYFREATDKVNAGIAALANQGVIQHVAAFDIFTRAVVQDIARFSTQARANLPLINHQHNLLRLSPAGRWVSDHCCHDIAGRLDKLSKRFEELSSWAGWKASAKLAPTLPIFDLIRNVRNRIAHDGGIVSADLESLAASKSITDALGAFRAGYARGNLPPLPAFKRARPLGLSVIHAILFGAFLYEVAKEINDFSTNLLNADEFIDMAFYYSCVVEEHPFRTLRHRSAVSRVSYYLASRYLRQKTAPSNDEVIRRLTSQSAKSGADETTHWKVALKRHEELLLR